MHPFSSVSPFETTKWEENGEAIFLFYVLRSFFRALNSEQQGNLVLPTSKTICRFSYVYSEAYSERIQLEAVNYFRKTLHFIFLTEFRIQFCLLACNYPSMRWFQSFSELCSKWTVQLLEWRLQVVSFLFLW